MSVLRHALVTAAGLAAVLLVALQLPFSPVRTVIVSGTSMSPTLHGGDVVVTLRHDSYRHGDVVAFRIPTGEPGAGKLVIHRIVGGAAEGFRMRGDNREDNDLWRPRTSDVVGTTVLQLPRVGLAIDYVRTPAGLGLLAALVTVMTFLGLGRRRRPGTTEPRAALGSERGLEPGPDRRGPLLDALHSRVGARDRSRHAG